MAMFEITHIPTATANRYYGAVHWLHATEHVHLSQLDPLTVDKYQYYHHRWWRQKRTPNTPFHKTRPKDTHTHTSLDVTRVKCGKLPEQQDFSHFGGMRSTRTRKIAWHILETSRATQVLSAVKLPTSVWSQWNVWTWANCCYSIKHLMALAEPAAYANDAMKNDFE